MKKPSVKLDYNGYKIKVVYDPTYGYTWTAKVSRRFRVSPLNNLRADSAEVALRKAKHWVDHEVQRTQVKPFEAELELEKLKR